MAVSVTELRRKIFTEIDKVIETGQPLEIERKGRRLKIILDEKRSKFASLVKRENIIKCSDDDLIYNNWIKEWKHEAHND